jgi:NAD(P)-dependent dehydrogenase (short-subunit alcohol dehydrogenase family)
MAAPQATIIVTGANGGLGTAIVTRILRTSTLASQHFGIYTVRKAATASSLHHCLQKAPSTHRNEVLELDLGRLSDVRRVAADINRRVADGSMPPIRALILNAGFQEHSTQVRLFAMNCEGLSNGVLLI